MALITETSNLKIIPIEVSEANILKTINFYLVEKNDALFLIDAGLNTDTYWEKLEKTLHEYQLQLSDLTAILLTHHHFDHVGLVHRISKAYDVPIYIHPYALPKLKGDPEFLYMNYKFARDLFNKLNCGDFGMEQARARYNRQMNNPESTSHWEFHEIHQPKLYDFDVIEIPGHAPDQVAFYLPKDEIIFLGDLLINHLRSNAFVEPDLNGNSIKALAAHQASLHKIINLNPVMAFSGHGTVIHEPAKLAKRRLQAIDKKAMDFLSLIESGVTTGSEIVKRRHPDKYEKIFFTVMSDALSFLDYLEDKGEVKKEEMNGVWHYSLS